MSARARDLLGSIIMLIFVGALWVQRDYITPFGGIFPDIVMVCLAGLCVLAIVLAFTPWRTLKEAAAEERVSYHWVDMAVVAVALLAWTVLLRQLGFAVAGIAGFGGIAWFLSPERRSARTIVSCFALGALLVFLLILVFEHLLKVPLPKGTLFD